MLMRFHPLSIGCGLMHYHVMQEAALRLVGPLLGADGPVTPGGAVRAVGSRRMAERIADRAKRTVTAYRDLDQAATTTTDKAAHIERHAMQDRQGDDWRDTFAIFRSSGSTGSAQYWPQLKRSHARSKWALRLYLEHCFELHRHSTVAIVGLSLGSWVGGDYLSWLLKSIAMDAAYPLCVVTPGNHHGEILDIIGEVHERFEQVLLILCPSAIGHLHLRAAERGQALPVHKLRYLVLGEPFAESMRLSLAREAELPAGTSAIFSLYGSADTGQVGIESPGSVAMRQLLTTNEALRRELGFTDPVPHLFHFSAHDTYAEDVDGELCLTRWQGVPLVRYNLHDAVRMYDWTRLQERVLASGALGPDDQPLVEMLRRASSAWPPVLAVAGRTDRCLILCGSNLTEAMLDSAVGSQELEGVLTGVYEARTAWDGDHQHLSMDLEVKPGTSADLDLDRRVYRSLMTSLGRMQPEFLEDWRNIYSTWDEDPVRRILQLRYHEWPALSTELERQPKRTGIRHDTT